MANGEAATSALPIVCQLGFAGSRKLFDSDGLSELEIDALESQVRKQLVERLEQLHPVLGLDRRHQFLCGISQVAIGADTVFTQACGELGLPQRILLPEPVDAYLAAAGSQAPDFTPRQREVARALLASPHVIEQRVASRAAERGERFQDVNLAILNESDVVICLAREDAGQGRTGGTADFTQRAQGLGIPLLVLTVSIVDGAAVVSPMRELAQWRSGGALDRRQQGVPRVLHFLALGAAPAGRAAELPDIASFLQRVKLQASDAADATKGRFGRQALGTIVTHVLATCLAAACAMFVMLDVENPVLLCLLLAVELLLLVAGSRLHARLHHREAAQQWAQARACAELMRSLIAADAAGASLAYAIHLTWDDLFAPLLRTCLVLQLHTRRALAGTPAPSPSLDARREAYRNVRLQGQITYYRDEGRLAAHRLERHSRWFWACTGVAVLAAASELVLHRTAHPSEAAHALASFSSFLAIAFPVIAVSFLSWAAASDWGARGSTFRQMHVFLDRQDKRIAIAESEREFLDLLQETETRLLSENIHWFERRSFTGVS